MGGIYIDCGSFTGSDNESGKPILFVLKGMTAFACEEARVLLARLMHDIDMWLWTPPTEFRIAPHDAKVLLSSIHTYRQHIESLLPSLDEMKLIPIRKNEVADGTNLRGPAHQYPCVHDLERAFETAVKENQPVILTWD